MPPLPDPALACVALAVEGALGYPPSLFRRVGHPVTWIGALIGGLDRRLNRVGDAFATRRAAGGVALVIVLAVTGAAALLCQNAVLALPPRWLALLVLGALASSCLAQRGLDEHVRAVRDALRSAGIEEGRRAVGMIVGRDTAALDAAGVARAAIESLAENFSDGIVAPALYIAALGLPGGMLYKAINTADSMIGHRTPRHAAFGFAAAKLDDVVNWPAARLAALWIALAAALLPGASAARAWRVTLRDARGHPSPNAGWPEAAMAGALGIKLGGPRAYGGRLIEDAVMGEGAEADVAAIGRALVLYRLACGLNASFLFCIALLIARWP
jgi:adenosylcobinamide-phosphate synthase